MKKVQRKNRETVQANTDNTVEKAVVAPGIASANDSLHDLEKIRALLFGRQVQCREAREDELEALIQQSVTTLRRDTESMFACVKEQIEKSNADVTRQIEASVAELRDAVKKEANNRSMAIKDAEQTAGDMSASIAALTQQSSLQIEQVNTQLKSQLDQSQEQLHKVTNSVKASLQEQIDALRGDKTDRSNLAALLKNMARQLDVDGDSGADKRRKQSAATS